jgi:hypothetical protein
VLLLREMGEHPAQQVLRRKDITDGVGDALNNPARVATPSKALC